MILIPQRLFGDPQVRTILRDGNVCILRKELVEPVLQREGYVSNHVVSMVLAGEQHIHTYDDELIKVRANEILFIPRGLYQVSDLLPKEGTFQSLLFYFDDELIRDFLAKTKVSEFSRQAIPSHLKFGVVPTIRQFADNLVQIYEQQVLQDRAVLRLKIMELLYLLNALVPAQQFADFLFRLSLPEKRNIKAFMQQNFDKPLKVEDYAYLTGRSNSSFRRDFKAYFDCTPQQWLRDQRLEKALRIVEERPISVSELAYQTGYENVSYFIRAFKEKVGLSPKQYMLKRNQNGF